MTVPTPLAHRDAAMVLGISSISIRAGAWSGQPGYQVVSPVTFITRAGTGPKKPLADGSAALRNGLRLGSRSLRTRRAFPPSPAPSRLARWYRWCHAREGAAG